MTNMVAAKAVGGLAAQIDSILANTDASAAIAASETAVEAAEEAVGLVGAAATALQPGSAVSDLTETADAKVMTRGERTKLENFRLTKVDPPLRISGWSKPIGLVLPDDEGNTVFAVDVEGTFLVNRLHSAGELLLGEAGWIEGNNTIIDYRETANAVEFTDNELNILARIHKKGINAGRFEFAYPPLVAGVALTPPLPPGVLSNTAHVVIPFKDGGYNQFRIESRLTGSTTFVTDGTGDDVATSISDDGSVAFTSRRDGAATYMMVPATGGTPSPVTTNTNVVVTMGDSNSSDVEGYYPQYAAVAGDRSTTMAGWSRQTSPQIAARQNGIPCTITVDGNTIPGSGTVTITAMSTRFLSQAGLTLTKQMDVLVNGVLCTVFKDNGTYANPPGAFTDVYTIGRKEAGDAVPVAPGTAIYTVNGINNRDKLQIIWPGRNDGPSNLLTVTKPAVAAMVAYLSPLVRRYLIFGIVPAGYPATNEFIGSTRYNQIRAYNDDMLATYGDAMAGGMFFDMHRYLVDECLTDAGLTATSNDLADIANDVPPRQIVTQDTTGFHWTTAARQRIAAKINQILTAKGW